VIDRPLIVLSLDGLATAALGCYGSSWNQTPAIDAIATEACVWDRWIADADEGATVLKQVIGAPGMDGAPPMDWASGWREKGSLELLTDSPSLIKSLDGACFDHLEALEFEPPSRDESPVHEIADSQLGRLVAAAVERGTRDDTWSVLWLHSTFLTQRWDAPRELLPIDVDDESIDEPSEEVELLATEADAVPQLERIPPIFDDVIPPHIEFDDPTHPDLISSWMRTYGCQVALLDVLVELLMHSLADRNPCLMLVGTSGFRLGQGGWFSHRPPNLRSTELRLPMMISDSGPLRVPQLTASSALPEILKELAARQGRLISEDRWSEAEDDGRIETKSDRADYAVTTPGWFLVRDSDESEHLFLKPDDVEDFNDISRLRRDVVKQLSDPKE
jgi:hypothetical protein